MAFPVRTRQFEVLDAALVRHRAGVLSVFGSQERQGRWDLPRHFRVACVMGSVELDLRLARIPEGISTIEIFTLMGSVELLFPPGVRVEWDGDTMMGEFSIESDHTVDVPDDAPTIRVIGNAFMGSVEGCVRFAEENAREARRRRRRLLRSTKD